jgi:hypothetical protein
MDAFHRLSRFGSKVKERASSVWTSAKRQFERGRISAHQGQGRRNNPLSWTRSFGHGLPPQI